MNLNEIANTAAHFNATHDYDLPSALKLTEIIIRHAHYVQLARIKSADPQLELPIELADNAR
jgi:hypothetical protein